MRYQMAKMQMPGVVRVLVLLIAVHATFCAVLQPGYPQVKDHCKISIGGVCLACEDGYRLSSGQCRVTVCEGKPFCGKATNFNSTEQLKNFIKQNPTIRLQSTAEASQPTLQEKLVDEADLLKIEGPYAYTISNGILSVCRLDPQAEAGVITAINLAIFRPISMLLSETNLVILGTTYFGERVTYAKIYDITNKSDIRERGTLSIEGSFWDARKTADGYIHVISRQSLQQKDNPTPWYDSGSSRKYIPPQNVYVYEKTSRSPIFVNVLSFYIDEPFTRSHAICMITESSHYFYLTPTSLYMAIIRNVGRVDFTVIHKCYLDRQYVVPFADTQLRGTLNNQFSMFESGTDLRVVTTVILGQPDSQRGLYYYALDFIFTIRKTSSLYLDEGIAAARFTPTSIYLSTASTTSSSLIIYNISSDDNVSLLSFKIDKVFTQLHVYSPRYVVGLGRQNDNKGLTISLLDAQMFRQASYFTLPTQYTNSEALFESKAFLADERRGILVIPAREYSNYNNFNGAMVFSVRTSNPSLSLDKIISHMLSYSDSHYDRTVERSFTLGRYLMTKSKCMIRVNDMDQGYQPVANLNIPCRYSDIISLSYKRYEKVSNQRPPQPYV